MKNFAAVIGFIFLITGSVISQQNLNEQESGMKKIFPPWGNGNPAIEKGVEFIVHDVNNVPDLHGNPFEAELIIFTGGNYFFAMKDLVEEFTSENSNLKGKIFYETLPPGIIKQQLEQDNTITIGNLTLQVQPDVFQAGPDMLKELSSAGYLDSEGEKIFENKLGIMVKEGNPQGISSLNDLAKNNIFVANPNPKTEGITEKIKKSLIKAGGKDLENTVYQKKVNDGSALITDIHHRQTPLMIMQNKVHAGVVWVTEVNFQKKINNPIDMVEIPDEQNERGSEAAALVSKGRNKQNGRKWIEFLKSDKAKEILKDYGFIIPESGI
jgi:ABC-type molybdate transport system substrate-binding protein